MEYKTAQKGATKTVLCGVCGLNTKHTVLESVETSSSDDGHWIDYMDAQIIQCRGCEEVSFRKASYNSEEMVRVSEEDWDHVVNEQLFPKRAAGSRQLDDTQYLPKRVCAIYNEVRDAVVGDQRTLAGIGIRAIIEAVCAEKSALGSNLDQKINDLTAKGFLTEAGARILHSVRLLGNKAVHEVAAPSPAEIQAALTVAQNLLANVYIIPEIAKALPVPTLRPTTSPPRT